MVPMGISLPQAGHWIAVSVSMVSSSTSISSPQLGHQKCLQHKGHILQDIHHAVKDLPFLAVGVKSAAVAKAAQICDFLFEILHPKASFPILKI